MPDTPAAVATARKPADNEVDVYGLTHPGRVRKDNQDHFLICSLYKQMKVHLTSLPEPEKLGGIDRLAFLAMVADGVGGQHAGEEASRLAIEAISKYVTQSVRCYYTTDPGDTAAYLKALEEAAFRAHTELSEGAKGNPERQGMATTLTLWLGVWPHAYLLQVGDSRCYIMRGGVLSQVSRDQTMAQDLVDQGILTRTDAQNSRLAHILSSAVGGTQAMPVVTHFDQAWSNVGLVCSDGLTRHVPDERIRERLVAMTSAKQACEALLQDALDGGGSDNITIIIGRAVPAPGSPPPE
jgi:protein phosphatase